MNVGDYVIAAKDMYEEYIGAPGGGEQLEPGEIGRVQPDRIHDWLLVRWKGGENSYKKEDLISLNSHFKEIFSPTEQEMGVFEMLYGETIKNNLLKALENKS